MTKKSNAEYGLGNFVIRENQKGPPPALIAPKLLNHLVQNIVLDVFSH